MIMRNPLKCQFLASIQTKVTYRRERLDLGLLRKVGELVLHVVHGHAAILALEA